MKSYVRIISILILTLALTLLLFSCKGAQSSDSDGQTSTPPADEYTLPLADGYNQLTFYWKHSAGYEN